MFTTNSGTTNDATYQRGHSNWFNSLTTTRIGKSRIISKFEKNIENQCAKFLFHLLFILFFLSLPYYLFKTELHHYLMEESFQSILNEIQPIIDPIYSKPLIENNGQLIYLHLPSNDYIKLDENLLDQDFGLEFTSAFEMKRKVEYCQWIENSHDEEYTDRDGETYTVRTYSYTKGWVDHLIPSIFFNQPANHHNPQRNPFPNMDLIAQGIQLANNYHIGSNNLISKHKIPLRKIDFTIRELQKCGRTIANSEPHNFKYIGNGYFFSPYQSSNLEKAIKLFGQFLEGSLLDWQIGDLFSNCEAGDIRISFYQAKPLPGAGISIIAKQVNERGELDTFIAQNGFHVGLIHEGSYSTPKEMLDSEVSMHKWSLTGLLGARILIIIWALITCLVLLGDFINNYYEAFIGTVMLSSLMLGLVWLCLSSFSYGLLSLISAILMFITLYSQREKSIIVPSSVREDKSL
ncbi:hypothetical protein ABK040_014868 [Willaertia magna]